ncbi:hypothetical protein NSTCB13_05946 [Nostoc sp. DSM 114160]|jgi:hypothetical protein
MSNITGGQQFYSALQAKAMAALKDILKSPLYPIQFPSQGDFFWYYQNPNQVFNQSTFDYISANISPGDVAGTAKLSAAGGFPNAYTQVVSSIAFTLSKNDQAALNKAQSDAQTQGSTIVADFQTSYGQITDAQLQDAATKYGQYLVGNKIDYIISVVLGAQWSGNQAANKPPLSYQQMVNARNLQDLLPYSPPGADQVISDISIYLNIMKPAIGLKTQIQQGSWIIAQLQKNTEAPSDSNGGIKTLNANTGAVSPNLQVGYSISKSQAAIQNDLDSNNTISFEMTTSQASGESVSVSIEGQAGFSVGSWLTFATTVGGSYDMSKSQGTSTDASIKLTWKGYSVVPMAPTAWQQATNVGWYYTDPIAQAVNNGTQDVTGFKFLNKPAYDLQPFAKGGNFGLLNNLVISNYPTIEITYKNANFSSFKQSWNQSVSGNLKLFGFIELGSFSQGAYGSSYQQGADNSTFTVTFSASKEVLSVPQLQKTAYVIGGAVTNPGVTSSQQVEQLVSV